MDRRLRARGHRLNRLHHLDSISKRIGNVGSFVTDQLFDDNRVYTGACGFNQPAEDRETLLSFAHLVCDRNVPGLSSDPFEPGRNRKVTAKIEASLVCNVCIGVERDIGDGVLVADEELTG